MEINRAVTFTLGWGECLVRDDERNNEPDARNDWTEGCRQ